MAGDVGNYKIVRLLGSGATSNVYLGVDKTSMKLVAIKKIRPKCTIGVRHKMFAIEASLCGKLKHPNIVALYDSNTSDANNSYIVLEYVEGESLEGFSSPDNLLPVKTVLDIVRQAAEGLNYACQMGVIHRDVKPANMLMAEDGQIKLTDFGCALLHDSEMTQIAWAGSLSYMSPEQISGIALNHQSDIYSLGAVLYQLLTGHSTFNATDNSSAIHQITTQPHIPIESRRAGLPWELCRIVNRSLQKNPADRYQDWGEFLGELYTVTASIPDADPAKEPTRFELVSQCTFFKDFLTAEVREVLRASQWRTFTSSETIIREGEHGFSFFILLKGSAVVSKKQRMLNVINAGDCVGEGACLSDGSPIRSATVTSQGETAALEISKNQLKNFSKEVCLSMDRAFLRSLNDKLAVSNSRVLQLMGI